MITFIKICGIISIIISASGMLYLAKNWFGLLENVLPEKKKWLYIIPYIVFFSNNLNEIGVQYRNKVVKGGIVFFAAMIIFILLLNISKKLSE